MPYVIAGLVYRCMERTGTVIAAWAIMALIGLASALWAVSWTPSQQAFSLSATPSEAQITAFERAFPNLKALVSLKIVGKTGRAVAQARDKVMKELQASPQVFKAVVSPGSGAYYSTYAFLYQDTDQLARRVAYVRELRPLLEAVASARSLAGLARLSANVAAAAETGSNPQVFVDFYGELAGAIQAAAQGESRAMNWKGVAGLDVTVEPRMAMVLAWPSIGADKAAADAIARVQQQAFPDAVLTVVAAPAVEQQQPEPVDAAKFLAAAAMTAVLAAIVLFVLSESVRFSLLVTGVWIAVLASAMPVFAVLSPLPLSAAPLLASCAVFVMLLIMDSASGSALAVSSAHAGNPSHKEAVAAQAMRGLVSPLVFVAAISGLLVFAAPDFRGALLACIAILAVAALGTLTLCPAVFALAWDRTRTYALLRASSRQIRKRVLVLLGVTAAVAALAMLPQALRRAPEPPPEQSSVSLLFVGMDQLRQAVETLKALPEVKGARWIEGFLPQDADAKINLITTLDPKLPREGELADGSPPSLPLAQSADQLASALDAIAQAKGVDEAMRKATLSARRSLTVLRETASEAALSLLERNVFSGLDALEADLIRLAAMKAPAIGDLDPDLRSLFVSAEGVYRLEVEPAEGVSPNGLALELARNGFVPVSRAVAMREQQRLVNGSLFAILGIGALAAVVTTMLARQNTQAAMRSILSVLTTCMIFVLALIAGAGALQQHHMVWALAVFSALWGQFAITPVTDIYRIGTAPPGQQSSMVIWFMPITALVLSASLWLVGAGNVASLAFVAAAALAFASSLYALSLPVRHKAGWAKDGWASRRR